MSATQLRQAQPLTKPASLEQCIVDAPRYTRVDFLACEAAQTADLYRVLAGRLLQSEVRCLLFSYSVCSAADYATLHDMLRMLLRTRERPTQLKLALLAGALQVERTFQRLQRDFRMTGIEVRIVADETEAQAWFNAP